MNFKISEMIEKFKAPSKNEIISLYLKLRKQCFQLKKELKIEKFQEHKDINQYDIMTRQKFQKYAKSSTFHEKIKPQLIQGIKIKLNYIEQQILSIFNNYNEKTEKFVQKGMINKLNYCWQLLNIVKKSIKIDFY